MPPVICLALKSAFILGACVTVLVLTPRVVARKSQEPPRVVAAQKQAISEGRQIFESNCAGCHGLDGRGGERGPDISTRQQMVQTPDEQLRDILRTGRTAAGMPSFASLGAVRLDAVLAYVRFLQGERGTAGQLPGDAPRGKSLFFGKAHCSECHMMQGQGGFLGRDLSGYGVISPREIRSNIVNAGRATRMRTVRLRNSQQITGIVRNEDNFSIQLQGQDGVFHLLSKADITAMEILPEPVMPTGYAATLTDSEFDDLVNFLVTAATSESKPSRRTSDDEE